MNSSNTTPEIIVGQANTTLEDIVKQVKAPPIFFTGYKEGTTVNSGNKEYVVAKDGSWRRTDMSVKEKREVKKVAKLQKRKQIKETRRTANA